MDYLGDIQFKSPGGVFDRILWNAGKIEAKAENRTAAFELCLYLLGETSSAAQVELIEKLRKITKDPHYELPKQVVAHT